VRGGVAFHARVLVPHRHSDGSGLVTGEIVRQSDETDKGVRKARTGDEIKVGNVQDRPATSLVGRQSSREWPLVDGRDQS